MVDQVLHNDILAHEPSVESVSRAASALLMENGDSKLESGALQMKVTELQNGWQEVLDKAARLDAELAAALSASHDVMDQMKELRTWLSESREFLYSRRQIGGRPESARNQITKHKVCLMQCTGLFFAQWVALLLLLLFSCIPVVINSNRPFPSSLVPLFQSESKCEIDLHENETACRTHFHMKGFALRLVLKQRHKRTRKWPIALLCSISHVLDALFV